MQSDRGDKITSLLQRLCDRVLESGEQAEVNASLGHALAIMRSNLCKATSSNDEFTLIERMKRKVQRERGERAANAFVDLAQQFQMQTVIRNRVGILQLLHSLSSLQDANSNYASIPKVVSSAHPSPNIAANSTQFAVPVGTVAPNRPSALHTSTPQSGAAKVAVNNGMIIGSQHAARGNSAVTVTTSSNDTVQQSGSSSMQQRSAGAALLQRSSGYSSIVPQSTFDLPTLVQNQTQSTLVQAGYPQSATSFNNTPLGGNMSGHVTANTIHMQRIDPLSSANAHSTAVGANLVQASSLHTFVSRATINTGAIVNAALGVASNNMVTPDDDVDEMVGNSERPLFVNELELLKDLIYVLQGVDGTRVRFDSVRNRYAVVGTDADRIPLAMRLLINRLAECGFLFRRIREALDRRFVPNSSTVATPIGVVEQSFAGALHRELVEYFRLIAICDAQIQSNLLAARTTEKPMSTQSAIAQPGRSKSLVGNSDAKQIAALVPYAAEMKSESSSNSNIMTLKRMLVWFAGPLGRLRVLAALADATRAQRGVRLVNAVYAFAQHGDPAHRELVRSVLSRVLEPVRAMLVRWIFDGELDDAHREFFVAERPNVTAADRFWFDRYHVRTSMIPVFIDESTAHRVLLIGKSIQFLRVVCADRRVATLKDHPAVRRALATAYSTANGEADAVQQHPVLLSGSMSDDVFDSASTAFRRGVDTMYALTSKYLIRILFERYRFSAHLVAMRKYLLLGQGDFIRVLMDLCEETLAQPAAQLRKQNLVSYLETAIRATNAQFDDDDIVKRLDVRILDVSPGDSGWDVFSLDYRVDGPLCAVFNTDVTKRYLTAFNFLWRAKRVEFIVAKRWRVLMFNSREFRDLTEMRAVLHLEHLLLAEMVHFVQAIQYFINFEVLECAWSELLHRINKEKVENLDAVIAAHDAFLNTVHMRILLHEDARELCVKLRAVFFQIVEFEQLVETVHRAALEERDRRSRIRHERARGAPSSTEDDESERRRRKQFQNVELLEFRARLLNMSTTFRNMVTEFLELLGTHFDVPSVSSRGNAAPGSRSLPLLNDDINLKSLSFRLDFNEFYRKWKTSKKR